MERDKTNHCHPPVPSPFPWLLYYKGKRSNTQIFFNIINEEGTWDFKNMSNNFVCTNSHGWMVMRNPNRNSRVCFLLNLATMEKIMLPPLKLKTWKSCILSSPPSDPTCIVGFFYLNRFKFWHLGEKIWREHTFNVENDAIDHTVYCEGKFYCFNFNLDSVMEVMVLDNHKCEMRQLKVEMPTWEGRGCHRVANYFVESLGEIFLVIIVFAGLVGNRILEVCVFKIDFKELEWIRVKSLGDHRVFFLSNTISMSCSTSGSSGCIKENSIYFILSSEVDLRSMYIYDMEEKTITTSLVCPRTVHNVTQGQWIMPNI
nr:F-box/kelch-repeat protein At1g57790-like [Ipomoea batatas]GME17858.1 F-box/kelch-repeat protein At1g57790-like [Ipomoea batatas]